MRLLYALPLIPPDTTYWAWGLPVMCLAHDEDQALAGGVMQAAGLVGRAMGLALAAAVQVGSHICVKITCNVNF
ncbi:hypothetical protein PG988_011772 [Apiospora saccharicola]